MLVYFVPALLGGLLGLLPWKAGEADYVAAMRLACLGAAAIGHLGVAWFVWRKAKDTRRVVLLVLLLPVFRLVYRPALELAQVFSGWVASVGALAHVPRLGLPVHVALFGAFAFLCALFASLAILSLSRRPGWLSWATWLALLLVGWLSFVEPADRTVSPHPFAPREPVVAQDRNLAYGDVVVAAAYPLHVRVVAALAWTRHLLTPDEGWSGTVATRRLHAFRERPAGPLADGLAALEEGWAGARPELTPPAR